jgi:uncharacterized Rossmann fold enzyme
MVKYLDSTKKQEVKYCIPLWLRDEQIKLAIARIKNRIEPNYEKRNEPIAIVCFGPSLNETWEKIKNFKYIISCSGSHKFLIEKGIIPTWHVEVDPRPHKTKLIGTPHKDVEYLISSTCHQAVFDHLEGFNVKLWHVFDCQNDAMRTLPHGEWALTGGASVGLRSMAIARFLGFTDLHIFGMDGCEGKSGKHAAEHPMQPKGHSLCEYNGVTYKTTISMLECARQTFHELDQMPGVNATFYGEGLVQAMAKDYKPNCVPKERAIIGVNKPELISEDYRKLNEELHTDNLAYGVGGTKHIDVVLKLSKQLNSTSILDYGCGKGYLAKGLPFPIWEYDPAIPGKEISPRPADIVICTDVLEHIEPDKIHFVLDDLRRCTLKLIYLTIHTGPSSKFLSDGRNAHLLQKNKKWWKKKLDQYFYLAENSIISKSPMLYIVAAPKPNTKHKITGNTYV